MASKQTQLIERFARSSIVAPGANRATFQSRVREDLKDGSLPKFENRTKLCPHQRQGKVAKGLKGQRVSDLVTNSRRAGVHLVKEMMVHPFSIRALQLLIDKLEWRVPAIDSRSPSQRQTVKKDRVIDKCSFLHANGQRGEDRKAKGRRSDSHQIGGIGEKGKKLRARSSNDRLSLEQMFQHCVGSAGS
jgi:hypothetical protein